MTLQTEITCILLNHRGHSNFAGSGTTNVPDLHKEFDRDPSNSLEGNFQEK